MSDDFTIVVVPDQPCPGCGAYWGNPDPALDFPNRVKVDDLWRCYNPECEVGYYVDGEIVELKLSPEEAAASAARIKADVDRMFEKNGPMVRLDDGSRPGIESWGWR
jgi:hypothetical protein